MPALSISCQHIRDEAQRRLQRLERHKVEQQRQRQIADANIQVLDEAITELRQEIDRLPG